MSETEVSFSWWSLIRLPFVSGLAKSKGFKSFQKNGDNESAGGKKIKGERIPPHPSITYSNSSDNITEDDEDAKSPKKLRANGEISPKKATPKKNANRKSRMGSDFTSDATSTDDDTRRTGSGRKATRKSLSRKAKSEDNFSSDQEEKVSKLNQIPESVRFDPNSLENKPKGLVDSLSKYFTPGVKRTSRTAMSTLLKPIDEVEPKTKRRKSHGHERVSSPKSDGRKSQSDSEGDKEHARTERKRHTSSGQSQVRSLYDGLSHLYTDCDSRLRHIPPANYAEKRRRQLEDGSLHEGDPGAEHRVRSPDSQAGGTLGSPTPQRVMSPHRMSDSELRQSASSAMGGIKPGTVLESSSAGASRSASRADSLRSATESGAEATESGGTVGSNKAGTKKGRKSLKFGSKFKHFMK